VITLSLPVLTSIFPGEPELAGFIAAKDDGSAGDNWSYKRAKLQSKHHHQQPTFYRPDPVPVAQPTVSKH